MKILFLIQKEFLQIFRDRFMLRLILIMPVVQLLVLVNAATYDIKNIRVHVVNLDQSNTSQQLISRLQGSNYFMISGQSLDDQVAYDQLKQDKTDLILKIPAGFAHDLAKYKAARLQVLINAINGSKAGLANAYLNHIIADFNRSIHAEWLHQTSAPRVRPEVINMKHRNWYNPTEEYKIFMVPGILVALVTLLAMFLSALNIVREKELGTIEQLNVTTIKKHEFIIGKLLPFMVIALVVLMIGLAVGRWVFEVPIAGSFWLLFLFAALYIVSAMGVGIVISNISATQQQAMFTSFFFLMIFILMSGLFTPIESMPEWAQAVTRINPLSYFIKFMRMVLLKGSGFEDTRHLFFALLIYAFAANLLALLTYRKTMGDWTRT